MCIFMSIIYNMLYSAKKLNKFREIKMVSLIPEE